MKRCLVGLAVLLSPAAYAQQPVPEIPYESVPNLLKLPPDMHLGEVAGVAVNSKGHIFVYSRGGSSQGPAYGNTASQILEFDRQRRVPPRDRQEPVRLGVCAHGARRQGRQHLGDRQGLGHGRQVQSGRPGGHGVRPQARRRPTARRTRTSATPTRRSPHVDGRFRQPTDVAWDPAGNIYISDGYVNSRIAKYDANGDWVKSWGQRGKGPGEFNLVHTIAADAQGNIYVGDRNNRRIQVFDGEGTFLREIKIDVPFDADARPAIGNKPDLSTYLQTGGSMTPGAPWAICITPPPNQVLYSSDSFPGRIYKLSLDGQGAGLARQVGQAARSSSAGSTRSPARPRTSSTSPRS